jgi:hypothetical protein
MRASDKLRFFILLFFVTVIAGGLLAIRFGTVSEFGRFSSSQRDEVDTIAISADGIKVEMTAYIADEADMDEATVVQSRAGMPAGITRQISIGPFESSVMALIVSAIATLLYVGYTATVTCQHRGVEDIAYSEEESTYDLVNN